VSRPHPAPLPGRGGGARVSGRVRGLLWWWGATTFNNNNNPEGALSYQERPSTEVARRPLPTPPCPRSVPPQPHAPLIGRAYRLHHPLLLIVPLPTHKRQPPSPGPLRLANYWPLFSARDGWIISPRLNTPQSDQPE